MNQVCTSVVKSANDLAKKIGAEHIFLISDQVFEQTPFEVPVTFVQTSAIAREMNEELKEIFSDDVIQSLKYNVATPALKNVKIVQDIATLAYIRDIVKKGYIIGVLCLQNLSSIIISDLKQFTTVRTIDQSSERVSAATLKAILSLALEIGREGREGKKVGTAFIVGDTKEVLKRSHQLILNPFEGYPEDVRDIKNNAHWETVKEFAQIDGVFIVNENGVMISAGRYLDVDTKSVELEGLGGRHISASAITRDTQAIAITVSESGGTVRIFKDGIETKIEPSAYLLYLLP
jgi:DNA integrity scanning protein DisA with diadenylate cyclase activity